MSQSGLVIHEGTIPANVQPRGTFEVILPDGSRIPVRCPQNRGPGDRFILRPYQVQIPKGIKKGKLFKVQADNRLFQVQCPPGKKHGDNILIRIPEFPEPEEPQIPFDQLPKEIREIAPVVGPVADYQVPAEYADKVQLIVEDMEVSNDFICPITQEIMLDPVIAVDGHSYERQAIEDWLAKHSTSPRTNERLPSKVLIPNIALRCRIIRFLEQIPSTTTTTAATTTTTTTASTTSTTTRLPHTKTIFSR